MGFLKVVYIIAVGVFVVLFFAFGIMAFYPEPQPPEYAPPYTSKPPLPAPPGVMVTTPTPEELEKEQQHQKEFEEKRQAFDRARERYSSNLFFIATPLGIATIVLGFVLRPQWEVIRSGLLLGGTITVLYGIIRSVSELSPIYRFLAIAVGLAMLLFLGYRRLSERRLSKSSESREEYP